MSLIKCKECGKEVSNKAKSCPSCGAEVKTGLSIIHIIGIVFGLIIIGIIALGNSEQSSTASPLVSETSKELTATDVSFSKGQYGNSVVSGKVVNTTGKKLGYVQVEINLYDKQGTQVGSTLANVNNLEPGIAWNFEAPVLEARAKSAKVAGITAY